MASSKPFQRPVILPFMMDALPQSPDSDGGNESFSQAPVARRSFELFVMRPVEPTITLEYPFHVQAREALAIVSLLCFLLVVAAPVGFWLLFRVFTGVVRVSHSGVVAKGIGGTTRFRFDEVSRIGLLEVPIVARGFGGALVRRRAGGDKAVFLVVKTLSGKTRKIMVSSYDDYKEILGDVSMRMRRPYEMISVGTWGMEWPKAA
jgi:hypothetical protein